MLAAEAEAVGAFAGSAIASPVMQIGTLISVIGFIFASQPRLGVLALGSSCRKRQLWWRSRAASIKGCGSAQALRDASDRISESEMTRVEDAVVADFQDAFESRRKIFFPSCRPLALSALSAAGAVGILFYGWLVLNGRSDVARSWPA